METPRFLRRRFTHEELTNLVDDIQMYVDKGKDLEDVIYYEIKRIITDKSDSLGLDDTDEGIYWKQYVKHEMELGKYIRERLFFMD